MDRITCYECEGSGGDSGALNEPEACPVCQGSGILQVEMDTRSSAYGQRKPIGRAPLPQATGGDFAEGGWARRTVSDQLDRERALLVCADDGRRIRAEPQDVVALLDFMDSEDGAESTAPAPGRWHPDRIGGLESPTQASR